jgi:hypothetical protein
MNDRLRPGREVRRLRAKPRGGLPFPIGRAHFPARKTVTQQIRQRRPVQAARHPLENTAAGDQCGVGMDIRILCLHVSTSLTDAWSPCVTHGFFTARRTGSRFASMESIGTTALKAFATPHPPSARATSPARGEVIGPMGALALLIGPLRARLLPRGDPRGERWLRHRGFRNAMPWEPLSPCGRRSPWNGGVRGGERLGNPRRPRTEPRLVPMLRVGTSGGVSPHTHIERHCSQSVGTSGNVSPHKGTRPNS